jgi:hypothetical protein
LLALSRDQNDHPAHRSALDHGRKAYEKARAMGQRRLIVQRDPKPANDLSNELATLADDLGDAMDAKQRSRSIWILKRIQRRAAEEIRKLEGAS